MKTPEKNAMDSTTQNAAGASIAERPVQDGPALEKHLQDLFREASQRIDHVTAGRLRAARREALDAARSPQRHTARWLIPAGAFAAVALATLMVWQPRSPGPAPANPAVNPTEQAMDVDNDLPPDAEKNDPNLYQNMDFYKWLAANNSPDNAAGNQPVNR